MAVWPNSTLGKRDIFLVLPKNSAPSKDLDVLDLRRECHKRAPDLLGGDTFGQCFQLERRMKKPGTTYQRAPK